jgi:phosphoribosylglycinamide formyltransferase-1
VTAAPTPPCRVVVLVSGDGSTLQALLDASSDPSYGVTISAVGSDRDGARGLARAAAAGVPTFVVAPGDYAQRGDWDEALAKAVAEHSPRFVVSAGFMRLLGPAVLDAFPVLNTHPALLPAFPGAHAVRDALAYGVQVTGCTVHLVDAGIDTGPVIAQRAVDVREGDDEATLHERIKAVERPLLVDVVGRLARDGWSVSGRTVTVP